MAGRKVVVGLLTDEQEFQQMQASDAQALGPVGATISRVTMGSPGFLGGLVRSLVPWKVVPGGPWGH